MKIGIVGLPNAGKSTLFNALTEGGAETGDYPFTTIEPNVASSRCPTSGSSRSPRRSGPPSSSRRRSTSTTSPGLVKGASQGEGLGNQFLASIRETDAICHVIRCHADSGVPHPEGRVDPLADIEPIETELLALRLRAGRAPPASGSARGPGRATRRRSPSATGWSRWSRRSPRAGRRARSRFPRRAAHGPRNLQALTSKPILYVANVDEGDAEAPPAVAAHAAAVGAGVVVVSARIEGELAELDPGRSGGDARVLGVEGSGLERLIRAAFELLDLITFFTAGEGKEAVARPLPARRDRLGGGGHDPHRDPGAFVRAEVIAWEELVECGGYAPPATGACCGSRAATTSSRTAT